MGGAGGDALSQSTGAAAGNSVLDIRDRGLGGNGGSIGAQTGSTGTGGAGGTGRGVGESGGAGGDGIAIASGTGLGFINVGANARGGNGGTGNTGATAGIGGNAFASAFGSGASGNANSTATAGTSTGYLVNDLNANATATVASTVTSQATAQYSSPGFTVLDASGNSSTALAYGAPDGSASLPLMYTNTVDPATPDSTPVHGNFAVTGTHNNHTFRTPDLTEKALIPKPTVVGWR